MAILSNRTDEFMHQEGVRTSMAALHPHAGRKPFHVVRLLKGFYVHASFGIAVAVQYRLTILRDVYYCIRRALRSSHEIGEMIAVELSSFRSAGRHVPEHRHTA